MTAETVVVLVVVMLGMLLAIWGASLIVRALASRASSVAMRLARRIPKRINTAPPTLSRVQFAFGMIVGPIACVAGVGLCAFVVGAIAFDGQEFRWSMIPPLVLVVFAAAALVVGIRWDKANGRRRCPKCWYDYAGLGDAAACPECGHVPTSARALARTRRSRPIMLAAPVLLIAAWLAHVTPVAMRTSWRAFVPTTVLIGFWEYMPTTMLNTAAARDDASLDSRIMSGEIPRWQKDWLSRRSLRIAAHTSDARICSYAAYFSHASGTRWSLSKGDAASANILRVGLTAITSNDVNTRLYGTTLLSQSPYICGPKAQAAFKSKQSIALDRFRSAIAPNDFTMYGRLIGRYGTPCDEVLDTVRDVMERPTSPWQHQEWAAALLGLLASKDDELRSQLEREYQAAPGPARSRLAIAILSSKVQQRFDSDLGVHVYPEPSYESATTRLVEDALRDPDPEIRRAAAKVVHVAPRLTLPAFNYPRLIDLMSEVATSDPECAGVAIRTLSWYKQLTPEIAPAMARVLESGSNEDVAMVAFAINTVKLNSEWLSLRPSLGGRALDTTLDQATLTTLRTAKAQLDALARAHEIDSTAEDADR